MKKTVITQAVLAAAAALSVVGMTIGAVLMPKPSDSRPSIAAADARGVGVETDAVVNETNGGAEILSPDTAAAAEDAPAANEVTPAAPDGACSAVPKGDNETSRAVADDSEVHDAASAAQTIAGQASGGQTEGGQTAFTGQTSGEPAPAGDASSLLNTDNGFNEQPGSGQTAFGGQTSGEPAPAGDASSSPNNDNGFNGRSDDKVQLEPVEISSVVTIPEQHLVIKKIIHYNCYCGADFTDKDAFVQHAAEGTRRGEIHSWYSWVEEVEVWE